MQLFLEEKFSLRGTCKCHKCDRRIAMGEKYIKFLSSNQAFGINVCHNCAHLLVEEFDKASKPVEEWNDKFLKLPKEERKQKFKMLRELEK